MYPGLDGFNPSICFYIKLSNFHDANPRFDGLTWFERLTQLIQILFFFFISFFFLLVFFFVFLINLFNYHTFMTRPCSQTHSRLLGPVLQPDSLKLESCKFNIIINIINITLESSVATKLKAFKHIFAE